MPRTALAIALLSVAAIGCAVGVAAQCCMWCPNGAGSSDSFSAGPAAAAATDAVAATTSGRKAGMRVGTGGYLVAQASLEFMVPPVPTSLNASLTSTLYSGITSQFGGDTWMSIALLTFDATHGATGSWAVQAQILRNGDVVQSGAKLYTPPDHQVTSQILQPYASSQSMSVTMSDPFNGPSVAQQNGFRGAADSNVWHVGWGWSDVAADCGVFPAGTSTVSLSYISAADQNGNDLKLDFESQGSLTPFCGLNATVTYAPAGSMATCTFAYTN